MATDLETSVAELIVNTNIVSDVINEDATTEIPTSNGPIPSLRKALADNFFFLDPLPWANGTNETVFNQIRDFGGLYYYAPEATTINPVPMGSTPVGDSNWLLSPFNSNVVSVLREELPKYTDLVYKSSGSNSAVDNMLAGDPIRSSIGDQCSTGHNNWRHTSGDGSMLSHYTPIGRTSISDFSGNDSQKLTQAISANSSIAITFGSFTFTSVVEVSKDLDIIFDSLSSCQLSGIDELLKPVQGCDSIKLKGGYFFANSYPTDRPQIIRNDEGVIGTTDPTIYPSTLHITKARTMNVGLADAHINTLNKTIVSIIIKGNTITSDDNTDTYIADSGAAFVVPWLRVTGFDGTRTNVDRTKVAGAQFTENIVDVYHESGFNKDVIKLTGTLRDYHVNDNPQIKNRNLASAAEIDTFTAGRGLQFNNNTLIDVSVKIQTVSGSLAPNVGDAWYMSACDNNITISSENRNEWAMLLRTSFGNVNSNNILFFGDTRASSNGDFSGILATNLDNNQNGFGSNNPAAMTFSGNTSTVIFTGIDSFTGNVRTANLAALQGCSLSGNVFSGGNDLLIPASAVRDSNTWVGNNIYSEDFTAEGVMRLNTSIVGAGNRIAKSPLNTDNLMIEASLNVVAGQNIEFTIPENLVTPQGAIRPCFLHIAVLGGARNNVQTFLFGRGNPDDADPYIESFSSRIDPNTQVLTEQRATFTLGFENGNLKLVNKFPANGDANDPTTIRYAIEPIGVGIYGAFV